MFTYDCCFNLNICGVKFAFQFPGFDYWEGSSLELCKYIICHKNKQLSTSKLIILRPTQDQLASFLFDLSFNTVLEGPLGIPRVFPDKYSSLVAFIEINRTAKQNKLMGSLQFPVDPKNCLSIILSTI